jgi:site-specific recombinase XerD
MHFGYLRGNLMSVGRHSLVQPRPADAVILSMNRACRTRRSRIHVEGPLASYFEAYSEYIADQGYSQVSYWKKTFLVSEFSRWLSKNDVSLKEITVEHEQAFLRHSARRRHPKSSDRIALAGATSWLEEKGVLERRIAGPIEASGVDQILLEYAAYLRDERGLASTTIENYAGSVRRFLMAVCGGGELRLAALRAAQIADFIRRNAPRDRTFAAAKNMTTALRSFFRFARYRDYVHADLAAAVPAVAGWSMASIPRAMPADCVRRLLEERKSSARRQDCAIAPFCCCSRGLACAHGKSSFLNWATLIGQKDV